MADNKSCGDVEKATKVLAKAGSEFDVLRYAAEAKSKGTQVTRNKVSEKLMVKMDFSETIKGLKTLQREARKATAALKEFEQAYNKVKPVADQCGISGQEITALLIELRGDN